MHNTYRKGLGSGPRPMVTDCAAMVVWYWGKVQVHRACSLISIPERDWD